VTYDDDEYVTDREKKISRALAVAMHIGFVLLLVFGVAWQKRHSEPTAVVDLWSTMAPPRQEPAPVQPAPKAEPKPEPRPEPKPRPAPKPEVKPVPKPDIALREKLEKERKVKEQQELEKKKKQQELEKKKQQQDLERRKEEEKQKEEVKRKLAQEAEAKRIAQEQADMKAKLAKEQASASAGIVDEYKRRIHDKIKRNIVEPPNLQGNPTVIFEVRLLPGGEILESSLRLRRSSGVPAYDQAVERAILKSSPLPLPPDPTLFNMFRELNLEIRPR
jgi:colicin import membrane protein